MIDSNPRIQTEGEPGQYLERVHLGSYELRKKGALRFDLRDPYHLAVALTWLQFLAILLALYLLEDCTEEEKAKIAGGNAARIYHLN